MRLLLFSILLASVPVFGSPDEMVKGVIRGNALKVRETLGNAGIFESPEYRFVDREAYRIKLPNRPQAIWFDPVEADWSPYAALDFRFYNPGNEEVILKLMIQSGDDGEAKTLPDYISVPSGVISIPKETEVFKRLMLNTPEFRKAVNLGKIRGVYLETRTDNAEVFLEGFRLLTGKEIEEESASQRQNKISAAFERMQKLGDMPERLRGELQKAEAALKAVEPAAGEADMDKLLLRVNELNTVVEALAAKGAVHGVGISGKLLAGTEKIFRDLPISTLPSVGVPRLAGNERGSFQLLLIPGENRGKYTVEAGDLKSENGASIPVSEITLNPVAYVEVPHSFIYPGSHPGWWPDPLLDNRPLLLDRQVQPVWVTVRVPENQPKGLYHGMLVVRNESGESVLEIPYSIGVRGFSLPKTAALQNLFSCVYRPEDRTLRRKLYSMLLDYRINPVNMYINAGTEMGYQPEREDLPFCIERGLNTLVLWHPKNSRAKFPYDYDEAYLEEMNSFIRGYEEELKSLNFWHQRAMVLGFDEVTHRGSDYADKASLGARVMLKNIRKNFPGLELASIGGPPLPEALTGPDNLWIPQPKVLSPRWKEEYEKIKNQKGSRFFLYWVYGNPGFMLDLPATSPRWTSWLAWQSGASGIAYYSIIRKPYLEFEKAPTGMEWSRQEFNIETVGQMARNACGTLVYPSPDGRLLPSIRLAAVRDGIQDYEYFYLLRELIGKKGGERFAHLLEIPETELYWNSFPASIEPLLNRREQVAAAIQELMDQP